MRECMCHPWVQCRHFEGLVVMLADVESPPCLTDKAHVRRYVPQRYGVAGPSQPRPCPCGKYDRITVPYGNDPHALFTDDKDEAEVEFTRREVLLLAH